MKKEAEERWKKAIEIDLNFADAYHNLTVYYFEQKDYPAAYNEWNFVKRINPEYPNVNKNIELVEFLYRQIPNKKE